MKNIRVIKIVVFSGTDLSSNEQVHISIRLVSRDETQTHNCRNRGPFNVTASKQSRSTCIKLSNYITVCCSVQLQSKPSMWHCQLVWDEAEKKTINKIYLNLFCILLADKLFTNRIKINKINLDIFCLFIFLKLADNSKCMIFPFLY